MSRVIDRAGSGRTYWFQVVVLTGLWIAADTTLRARARGEAGSHGSVQGGILKFPIKRAFLPSFPDGAVQGEPL